VVRARVKNKEAGIFELDQRPHHERHGVERRPRTDVMWPDVNVHLWRVDLQRQLADTVDEPGSYEVVQRRPLGELYVQLDEVQCSLSYKITIQVIDTFANPNFSSSSFYWKNRKPTRPNELRIMP